MKRILSKFLIATALLYSFSACKKDNNLPDNITDLLPSAEILASEKLQIPAGVEVPANLPAGNIRVATFFAEGVQKYKARPKEGYPSVFEWMFVAPEADLYDITDTKVGKHGAGPYWSLSATDSIFAQQFNPVRSAASPDGQSIDWLLLKAKEGKSPTGLFSDVKFIQRILTKGGKPPATAPLSGSETVNVKYTAIYRFTKEKL